MFASVWISPATFLPNVQKIWSKYDVLAIDRYGHPHVFRSIKTGTSDDAFTLQVASSGFLNLNDPVSISDAFFIAWTLIPYAPFQMRDPTDQDALLRPLVKAKLSIRDPMHGDLARRYRLLGVGRNYAVKGSDNVAISAVATQLSNTGLPAAKLVGPLLMITPDGSPPPEDSPIDNVDIHDMLVDHVKQFCDPVELQLS